MDFTIILREKNGSLSFELRKLTITSEPLKIGRLVGKEQQLQSNGLFDSKVLSRNHAVIWSDGNNVLLKDTKSSNGTYVNDKPIGRNDMPTEEYVLQNGDVIQFGIELQCSDTLVIFPPVIAVVEILIESNLIERSLPLMENYHLNDKEELQSFHHISETFQKIHLKEHEVSAKINVLNEIMFKYDAIMDEKSTVIYNVDLMRDEIVNLTKRIQLLSRNKSKEELNEIMQKTSSYENKINTLKKDVIHTIQMDLDFRCRIQKLENECSILNNVNCNLKKENDRLHFEQVETSLKLDELLNLQQQLIDTENQEEKALNDIYFQLSKSHEIMLKFKNKLESRMELVEMTERDNHNPSACPYETIGNEIIDKLNEKTLELANLIEYFEHAEFKQIVDQQNSNEILTHQNHQTSEIFNDDQKSTECEVNEQVQNGLNNNPTTQKYTSFFKDKYLTILAIVIPIALYSIDQFLFL